MKIKERVPVEKKIDLFENQLVKPKIKIENIFRGKRIGPALIVAFAFILLGVVSFLYLPSVKIDLWIETEALDFKQDIEVSKAQKEVDPVKFLLPGKVVIEEQTISQNFEATATSLKETKAEGMVTLYNNYSTVSQTLVADTRLVSSEGKLFRLVEKVVIPGQATKNGKLSPGSVEALARADLAGEQYNIGPTTFSIPGFAGTPRYTYFYAKSTTVMAGGTKGELAAVSDQDLDRARQTVLAAVEEKIDQALSNRTLPALILVKEGSKFEVITEKSGAKAGDVINSFSYEIKAKKEAVLFTEDDLKSFIGSYLAAKLAEEKRFLPESLKTELGIKSVDSQNNKAQLSLKFSVKTYDFLDVDKLHQDLAGLSLESARKNLEELKQISRATIKVFPSFVKNLPDNLEKINLKISFE